MDLKMLRSNWTLHDLEKPFARGKAADLRLTCTERIILHTATLPAMTSLQCAFLRHPGSFCCRSTSSSASAFP